MKNKFITSHQLYILCLYKFLIYDSVANALVLSYICIYNKKNVPFSIFVVVVVVNNIMPSIYIKNKNKIIKERKKVFFQYNILC
jgi:hypothetical protein